MNVRPDSEYLSLLRSLNELLVDLGHTGHSARIFFTGNEYIQHSLREYFVQYFGESYQSMYIEADPSDISKIILHAIENDINDVPRDTAFEKELVSSIIRNSGGMSIINSGGISP